jgi:hypothetical protein
LRVGVADTGGAGAHVFDRTQGGDCEQVGAECGGEQHEREPDSEFTGEVADSSVAVGQGRRDDDDAAAGNGSGRDADRAEHVPSGGVVDDQLAASRGGEFRR